MSKGALLGCLGCTLFMTGVMVFVRVVHYPLFGAVGPENFRTYHAGHVRLTTYVVMPPMVGELLLSLVILARCPPGTGKGLAAAGLAAALVTWGVTGAFSVPAHEVLSRGFDPAAHRRLLTTDLIRLGAWVAHSGILLLMTWKALRD